VDEKNVRKSFQFRKFLRNVVLHSEDPNDANIDESFAKFARTQEATIGAFNKQFIEKMRDIMPKKGYVKVSQITSVTFNFLYQLFEKLYDGEKEKGPKARQRVEAFIDDHLKEDGGKKSESYQEKLKQFIKKYHFRNFLRSLKRLHDFTEEDEFWEGISDEFLRPIRSLLDVFLSFQVFYDHHLQEKTIRPPLLRVTARGKLELVTRWLVARHQQEETTQVPKLTAGIDLGLNEFMTLDIRDDDPGIADHEASKYLFSASEGTELKASATDHPESSLIPALKQAREQYYAKHGKKENGQAALIKQKCAKISHLWEVHQEAYSRFSRLASVPANGKGKSSLCSAQLNLLRKHHVNAQSVSDKIKRSGRELAHVATSFIRYLAATAHIGEIHAESLKGFEILGSGRAILNRDLSNWVRGLFNELMNYKTASIKAGTGYSLVSARYTSKRCYSCGNIGRRGIIGPNDAFTELGYGTAFRCSNPLCPLHDQVIHADLNAARNICH
jgi:transposase